MLGLPYFSPKMLIAGGAALTIAVLAAAYMARSSQLEVLRAQCKATALEVAKDQITYSAEYGRLAAKLREVQLQRDMDAERAALRDSARSDEADRKRIERLENAQKQDPGDWGSTPLPDDVRDRLRQFQADFANRTG